MTIDEIIAEQEEDIKSIKILEKPEIFGCLTEYDKYCLEMHTQIVKLLKELKQKRQAIEDIREEIEEQIERDFRFAETEDHKVPCHYGTANGLQVALSIIDRHTSRKGKNETRSNL